MSNTSTLFDGIDDDNLVNTNQVAEKDQTLAHAQDQSQQDPKQNTSQVSEVDPFDMRNFNSQPKTTLIAKEGDDFISQTRTLKLNNGVRLYDPMLEIAKLKEQLRLKNAELQRMTLRIDTMHTNNSNTSLVNIQEEIHESTSSYHLAFMFSSPLVRRINSSIEMIMQLDYQNEISGIERQLKGVKHEIRYKVDVATISNFRSVVADAPFALHFTGHGIQNDRKALGSAYMQYKDKGNILLLEDENGMADYLFENDLKRLVQLSKANRAFAHNYEVVFVSSCYSEFAGRIFLASGARHVICIQKDQTISDKASLRFSRVFYETVFVKKYSVCKAFQLAKDDIRILINAGEADKFMFFVNDLENNKKHKCFPITNFKEGTLTKHETVPFFNSIPSIVENFKGRQQEMCEVISLLHESRLVNILGPPGIGKTSLARNLLNHLKDRRRFDDGIIYVALRGCESAQMFLTRLSLAIQSNAEQNEENVVSLQKLASIKENSENEDNLMNKEDVKKMRQYIINILRSKEVLIALDNCEDPLEDD